MAAGAARALRCIAQQCGYGGGGDGLREMVVANGDYLVEALCRQLRHLEAYPTTPKLFAAILRHTGAGAALLPLLVEPATAALDGLQVTRRHLAPLSESRAANAGCCTAELPASLTAAHTPAHTRLAKKSAWVFSERFSKNSGLS